jgi:hypothetical protein
MNTPTKIESLIFAKELDDTPIAMIKAVKEACNNVYPKMVADTLREPIWNIMCASVWRPIRTAAQNQLK